MQGNLRALISCAKIGVRIQHFGTVPAVLSGLSQAGVITPTSECREREVVKCCMPLRFLLGHAIINNITNVTCYISSQG